MKVGYPLWAALLPIVAFLAVLRAGDEKALLAAIKNNPGEDTPRLMYADWLDEQGESARAELIRLQIEEARTHLPWLDAQRNKNRTRIEVLLEQNREKWLPPNFHEHIGESELIWDRGFPSTVHVALHRLTPTVVKALNQLSMVTAVQLDVGNALNLGQSVQIRERLAGLRPLQILKGDPAPSVEVLTNAAEGVPLQPSSLERFLSEIGKARHVVLTTPHFARLRADHVAAFARLSALERLDIRHMGLDPEAVRALAQMKELGKLRALTVSSLSSIRPLLEAGALPALEELSVASWRDSAPIVGDEFLASVRSPGFGKLRYLKLPGLPEHAFYSAGLSAIPKAPTSLLHLEIGGKPIAKDVYPALSAQLEANRAALPNGACFLIVRELGEI